jgi:hypothetical protein
MTSDARKGLRSLRIIGLLVVLAVIGALAYAVIRIERARADATPHLDGQPGALREALRFPRKGFPTIPDVERDELKKLIPLDRPIRLSAVPAWTTFPADPALGAASARGNAALGEALEIIARIERRKKNPDEAQTAVDEKQELANARERLTAAEDRATPAMEWMVDYNRGVLYDWQGNRQRAAHEFQRAYENLKPRVERAPSLEVRVAAIHALYGWGDALIHESDDAETANVPADAINRLRDALVQATSMFDATHPKGVGHPAEFFAIGATGLSTRTLRNDLLAAYLNAPDYSRCGNEPMRADVCATKQYSGTCAYRDKKFCETNPSNRLRDVYDAELAKFKKGETKEGTFWALQNAAELEAENVLDDDPELSYNIAHLLLDLKNPALAYEFISAVTEHGDQTKITDPVARLAFVTSILSGAKLTANTTPQAADTSQPGDFRYAYQALYKDNVEPPPFQPLSLDEERKARSLDAWLFIRRYRYLLGRGQFETFLDEHRKVMAMNVPHDFLNAWKSAVVVELAKNAAEAREKAQPETKVLINRLLARDDLFTDAELKAAKIDRPFSWWKLRWLFYVLAGCIAVLLAAVYFWLCGAYESTFLSAYQRDRIARERLQGGTKKSR